MKNPLCANSDCCLGRGDRLQLFALIRQRAIVAMVFCLGMASVAKAQIQLDRFFPPVVAANGETEIVAEGKFPNWPPEIVCDRDDVEFIAQKDSGNLTVKLGAVSGPTVAWVRMYDKASATALVPLLITNVPIASETEPNDKRADANPISLPTVLAGKLAKGGDSDAYKVAVKSGEQLVVAVTANHVLKSPMDAVLQLTDLRGNVLAQSDDVCGLDPQLVYHCDADGELLIRIFAFPETPNSTVGFGGSSSFVYTIDVTTGPFLDHVLSIDDRLEPSGYNLAESHEVRRTNATDVSPEVASIDGALGWSLIPNGQPGVRRIANGDEFDGVLPVVMCGHIAARGELHSVSVRVAKGVKYRAEVRSKLDGFLMDSKLTVIDSKSGSELASNDDVSRGSYDAGTDFTAKEDGLVEVQVSEMLEAFGPRHYYELSIRKLEPDFDLTLAADHFAISGDKPLEIPVSVSRAAGFDGKIQITADQLPAGITVEPVVSQPKGDTAKSVKLKLVRGEASAAQAAIQIVGTVLDANDQPTQTQRQATFQLRPAIAVSRFWLTVPPIEEEKEK